MTFFLIHCGIRFGCNVPGKLRKKNIVKSINSFNLSKVISSENFNPKLTVPREDQIWNKKKQICLQD